MFATTVSSFNEIEQILSLQKCNLANSIDDEELETQGFVTLEHPPETLALMNKLRPSIIIRDEEDVVAYALVLTVEGRQLFPPLEPMFENLDTLFFKDHPLTSYKFYIMGQICIAKAYRGKGLFEMLYNKHRELFKDEFDMVITEISTRNHRSLRAHERLGFRTIHKYRDVLDEWAVVVWDWV